MALRPGNKLGIEFHQTELRVFESKIRGNDLVFGCVGSVPMDFDYIQNGVIGNPQSVGERLRIFLDRQRVTTTDVVASFPTDNCVARVLNLPHAPESELRSLINGEVEHFGLIRQGGVYDHLRLSSPPKEGVGTSVLFMATEGTVISSIDQTLEAAGLRMVALEPTHVALFRAANALAIQKDQTLFLTISEYRSDVSLLNDGKIAFYRSFEVGSNELSSVAPSETMFPETDDLGLPAERTLNLEAAASIAIELRRSIDYFSREMPDAPRLTRIVIAANTPSVEPLSEWLQEATNLDTEFIRISGASIEDGSSLTLEDGVRFLTVYGLAVRDSHNLKDLPRLDLSLHEQMVSELELSDRKARLAAYVCCGVLLGALIAAGIGTMKLRTATEHNLLAKKDLKVMQDLESQRIADLQRRTDRLALLRKQGIPVNQYILGVGRSIPAQAGLSDIRLTSDKIDLSGEANAEEALVKLTRSLQMQRFVSSVSLNSFERLFDTVGSRGIRFRMTVNTLGASSAPSLANAETEASN